MYYFILQSVVMFDCFVSGYGLESIYFVYRGCTPTKYSICRDAFCLYIHITLSLLQYSSALYGKRQGIHFSRRGRAHRCRCFWSLIFFRNSNPSDSYRIGHNNYCLVFFMYAFVSGNYIYKVLSHTITQDSI